jgi:hypothetical protein
LETCGGLVESDATPRLLQETEQRVTAELDQWGAGAADYSKQRVAQIKELMVTLAGAAEVAGERDQRYVKQFQDFTGRLKAIVDLCDLAQIRDSLMKSAIELKSCATAMAEEARRPWPSFARTWEPIRLAWMTPSASPASTHSPASTTGPKSKPPSSFASRVDGRFPS